MKKVKKFLVPLFFIFSSSFAFSANKAINNALEDISQELNDSLPQSAMLLNTQPDAFIGRIWPAYPPHWTFGSNISGTIMDSSPITDNIEIIIQEVASSLEPVTELNINFTLPSTLIIPNASFSGRIGFPVLPMDIGLFGMMLHNLSLSQKEDFDMNINYMTFGADLRYAIMQGNTILPKLSIGIGYIYSNLNISLDYNEMIDSTLSGLYETELNINAESKITSHTFFVQSQISRKFSLFTPYFGIKCYTGLSSYDYSWSYTTSVNGTKISSYSDSDKQSKSISILQNSFRPVITTGCGLDLKLFQTSFNLAYNPMKNYLSMGLLLGVRM